MDSVSAVLINKALDGLSMRMVAISENIANMQSKDFRPVKVSFEEALKAASSKGTDAINAVEPKFEQSSVASLNGELRVDMELAAANATKARYGALIDVLNRQMQLSRTIIKGGR